MISYWPSSKSHASPIPNRSSRQTRRTVRVRTRVNVRFALVCETYLRDYEAAANVSGTPMITRILTSSRESNRETCIWLVPIASAISDWERCS